MIRENVVKQKTKKEARHAKTKKEGENALTQMLATKVPDQEASPLENNNMANESEIAENETAYSPIILPGTRHCRVPFSFGGAFAICPPSPL